MNSNIVNLDELDLTSGAKPILVRVLRMWEARNFKRKHELMSLDFLLIDKKDCVMQGSIPVKHIDQFKQHIREGEVFVICNFDVLRSGDKFKMTEHKYMIRLKEESSIEQAEGDHPIQLQKFRMHKYEQLLQLADTGKELPDVIGLICDQVPDPEDIIHGKPKRLELRLLLEEGFKVRVTIWEQMVNAFYDKLSETKDPSIVIIVTSVNPKQFGRNLFLNTTSSTKFFINSEFEIVKKFRER